MVFSLGLEDFVTVDVSVLQAFSLVFKLACKSAKMLVVEFSRFKDKPFVS